MIDFIKIILGMKLGYLLLIVGGLIFGLSLIKNIFNGSFSITKFASGFNIFNGGVEGKLIYYGLIIFGCFLVFNFVMRPTQNFDTDYRNNINNNQDVFIDQKVGAGCIPTKILFGLIQIGCDSKPMTKTVNNVACEECKK